MYDRGPCLNQGRKLNQSIIDVAYTIIPVCALYWKQPRCNRASLQWREATPIGSIEDNHLAHFQSENEHNVADLPVLGHLVYKLHNHSDTWMAWLNILMDQNLMLSYWNTFASEHLVIIVSDSPHSLIPCQSAWTNTDVQPTSPITTDSHPILTEILKIDFRKNVHHVANEYKLF